MKKVYLISVKFRHKGENVMHFLPKVFAAEKLAKRYCEFLNKFSKNKINTYAVIRTDMYFQKPYVDELCQLLSYE